MPRRRPAFVPRLVALEDRAVPAGYAVNDSGDGIWDAAKYPDAPKTKDGVVTLRSAMQYAAPRGEETTITFAKRMTISVGEALPPAPDGVPFTVDASGQASAGAPGVAVVGKGSWSGNYDGFHVASNAKIVGLNISGFRDAVFIGNGSANVTVRDCYIGTNMAGTAPGAAQQTGISAKGSTSNVTIKNCVLSGNTGAGVSLSSPTGHAITGCKIGTDPAGTKKVANGNFGVRYVGGGLEGGGGGGNVIGGAGADGNVISGNGAYGVFVVGVEGLRITGNMIGVGASGDAIPNGRGVFLVQGAKNTAVGAAGAGNVIAGNDGDGVVIQDSPDCTVQGNFIGVTVSGQARPNGGVGVNVAENDPANPSSRTLIGGPGAGAANVIAANADGGVRIGAGTGNKVQNNLIGTTPAFASGLGNAAFGVEVAGGATNTEVGGGAAGTGNVIVGSLFAGVDVTGGTGTRVRGNTIGVTPNGDKMGNGHGVDVGAKAANTTIGGAGADDANVIAGNGGIGVYLAGTAGVAAGNYIGTDRSSRTGIGNGGVGVWVAAADARVGGLAGAEANVIAGSGGPGVSVEAATGNTRIWGNVIGTDKNGAGGLGNAGGGVAVGAAAQGTVQVGGGASGAGNVVAGNAGAGVAVTGGAPSRGVVIAGNLIGGLPSGGVLGNGVGINITGLSELQVGGAGADDANWIAGNTAAGVLIHDAENILVEGNKIGTTRGGAAPGPGNGVNGVSLSHSSHTVIRGNAVYNAGTAAGAAVAVAGGNSPFVTKNTIAADGQPAVALTGGANGIEVSDNTIRSNGRAEVVVSGGGTIRNTIARNSIAGASSPGVITLSGGGNNNFAPGFGFRLDPLLLSGNLVYGFAPGGPALAYPLTVELFANTAGGQTFLASFVISSSADSSGSVTVPGAPFGAAVVAAITDGNRNTSAFIPQGAPSARPDFASGSSHAMTEGSPGAFAVAATGDPDPTLSLAGGTLPAGVTFDPATGKLAGTPAAGTAGRYNLTFRATNSAGTADQAFTLTVAAPANTPPTISPTADPPAVGVGAAVGPLAFTVGDTQTPAGDLVVFVASDNPTLVPTANVALGGAGASRTVTVTPAAGASGTATITLTVADGNGTTASETFAVTVTPAAGNTDPTISPIPNPPPGAVRAAVGPLAFAVADAETPAADLTLAATSSNPSLVPEGNIVFGGSGADRTVTLTPGVRQTGTCTVTLTVRDANGGTAATSFEVTVRDDVTPAGPKPVLVGFPQFGAGQDAGGGQVTFFGPDKTALFTVTPFPGFTGGVRTAAADFNGDGVADLVVGTGPGRATRVLVLDGKTQAQLFAVDPFEATFTGGVYVAAGDVTGDGRPDLVITPDEGGGPRCRVFDGAGVAAGTESVVADFFGIDDPAFRGGARAAVGDIDGDGVGDLVVAAGFQGGPRVAGYSGATLSSGSPRHVFPDFFAFEEALRNGIFVSVGDTDGDGFAEVIAGGGPGGGPRVTAFSGGGLVAGQFNPVANFFGGDPDSRGGIRVAVKNLDADARADLVVGAGTGAGSRVTGYYGKDVGPSGTPPAALDFDAFSGFAGGVFVG